MIEHIDSFPFYFHFVATHSIKSFIQPQYLQKLGTIKLVVTRIYGKSSRSFILIFAYGLGPNDTHALSVFTKFYPQYVQLVETYNIAKPTTFLAKNVSNFMFGEQ
jgi:hypothetical protein